MGCVTQIGEQALDVGRIATLVAGWPETVCASTIDRQCGSSMQAAFNGAAAIQAGHLDVVVAAGVESMSRVPMGSNLGAAGFEGFSDKLYEQWQIVPQGISAEVIAEEWGLTREAARRVLVRVAPASDPRDRRGPVRAGDRSRRSVEPACRRALRGRRDAAARHVRWRSSASLKPAFKEDGVVTAGIVEPDRRRRGGDAARQRGGGGVRLGLEPRGRFVSFGLAGVDPYRMLHGNPQSSARALEKAGLGWDDMAVIEINEAFASVVLQTLADTGLHERWEAGDVNPNGGGISLGHPLGATGARITATLLNELDRRNERYGLATMCIGQGQAIAAVIERL